MTTRSDCNNSPRCSDEFRHSSSASILRKANAYFVMAGLVAGPRPDHLHRRSSWGAWGQANLQDLADRPSTYYAQPAKRRNPAELSASARQAAALETDKLLRLRRARGLAPPQARRLRCCPM